MKEKETVSIVEIKIQLKDKEISLSAEDARKVYLELQKLFALEKTDFEKLKEEWEKPVPQTPIYPYHPPIVIERWPQYPHWEYPIITCATDASNNIPVGYTNSATLSINLI